MSYNSNFPVAYPEISISAAKTSSFINSIDLALPDFDWHSGFIRSALTYSTKLNERIFEFRLYVDGSTLAVVLLYDYMILECSPLDQKLGDNIEWMRSTIQKYTNKTLTKVMKKPKIKTFNTILLQDIIDYFRVLDGNYSFFLAFENSLKRINQKLIDYTYIDVITCHVEGFDAEYEKCVIRIRDEFLDPEIEHYLIQVGVYNQCNNSPN